MCITLVVHPLVISAIVEVTKYNLQVLTYLLLVYTH